MAFPSLDMLQPQQKQTATPTHDTGWEYVDKGPACERSPAVGHCVLDSGQRHRIEEEIVQVSGMSLNNYHAALGNAHVELLLKKDGGHEVLGGLVIELLASALLGGLGMVAARFARSIAAEAVWTGEIASREFDTVVKGHEALFTLGVREIVAAEKGPLKKNLAGYSSETIEHLSVLADLQNSASSVFLQIVSKAKVGDDAELVWARAALDPDRLTVSWFSHRIDDLLARFAASHLDQLGTTKTGPVEDGERRVVQFVNGSTARMAVIDVRERKLLGRSRGDDWYTPGGTTFVSWVDSDLGDVATDAQSHHGTGKVEKIEVSADTTWDGVGAIWAWKFGGVK